MADPAAFSIPTDRLMHEQSKPETEARRGRPGHRGGIRVDEHMRTSDPHIWAVGDAVEIRDAITGVPRARSPRPVRPTGRAADGHPRSRQCFRGVQATSVVGILDLVAAFTGRETALKNLAAGRRWKKSICIPITTPIIIPAPKR